MPYWRIFYHLVWAFKDREELLSPELEKQLYSLLWKIAANMGCSMLAMGGWKDHIHLILSIPPSLRVSDVVHRLKGASAHELELSWQDSYGAFSVGQRALPVAIAYVKSQKSHHLKASTNPWLERWDEENSLHCDQIRENAEDYSADDDLIF